MDNFRDMTAWSPSGQSVIKFTPSPKIKLLMNDEVKERKPYNAKFRALAPAIARMRTLGNTFEHIGKELGINPETARKYSKVILH